MARHAQHGELAPATAPQHKRAARPHRRDPAPARRAVLRRRARGAGRAPTTARARRAGGCRRGRSSPTCWAACSPTARSSSPKYVGQRRLIEIAVATLATDRALLLLGVPGTAKTWVSEHLAAAISGDSTLLVQGTAGTTEETLRYGWNYARLLAEGPSEAALVPSPVYRAMRAGSLVRVEELTRMPSDVQDALVTILSEKTLPVPELDTEVPAVPGFNLIATANDRDRGVNELSSALRRRFNTVVLPLPETADEEMAIVARRVAELGAALALPAGARRAPTRSAASSRSSASCAAASPTTARTSLKVPSGTLSTAEAISVVTNGLALAAHFGDGTLRADDVAAGIVGAVVRDPVHDAVAWREYLEAVVRDRDGWGDFYDACRDAATDGVDGACRGAPARHPAPRARLGALGACGRSTSCSPTSCSSSRRPRPTPALRVDRRRRARAAGRPARLRRRPSPQRAVFAPLASFSPEWQAVALGATRDGVAGARRSTCRWPHAGAPADDERRRCRAATAPPPDPLGALAAAAGEPDAERWWDDVVEHRGDGEPAFEAVAEAMAAVRAGTVADRRRGAARGAHAPGASAPRCATGTRRSPSCAGRGTCRRSTSPAPRRRRRHGHAARPAEGQGRRSAGCRGRTAGCRGHRYGAGVASPGWYDHVFRHPGPEGIARFFVDAAHVLRAPRHAGVARPPDRRVAPGRRAGGRCAAARGPGSPRCSTPPTPCSAGCRSCVDELVVGDAIGEVPAGRRRCRSPATSPRQQRGRG